MAETLESLLSQSYGDLELVISDNASTDSTESIANDYARKDQRIAYFRNPENVGIAINYNKTFERSNGKYFKWAAVGDICDSEFIAKCVEVLEARDDVVLCYPRARLFSDDRHDSARYDDNLDLQIDKASERFRLLLANLTMNNAMNGLIRSDVLRRTILVKAFWSSDKCLMAELSLRGKFFELPQYLFYRRIGESTSTTLKSNEERSRYFHPTNPDALLFQHTKRISTLYGVVARAPIPLLERIKSYGYLLGHTYRYKKDLNRELKRAIAHTLQG